MGVSGESESAKTKCGYCEAGLEYLPRVLSAVIPRRGIMQPDKHDLELYGVVTHISRQIQAPISQGVETRLFRYQVVMEAPYLRPPGLTLPVAAATHPTYIQPPCLCPTSPSDSLPVREASPATTSGPSAILFQFGFFSSGLWWRRLESPTLGKVGLVGLRKCGCSRAPEPVAVGVICSCSRCPFPGWS